jgi:release factor glutamine methyltransferase
MSQAAWTIARLLSTIQGYFAQRGIASARLDAEVLLSHVLGQNRMYLYTHFDQPLGVQERDALRTLTRRRGNFEPIAYLCGHREFYSRDFKVTPAVLIPRPETEHVVECALAWLKFSNLPNPHLCDVGTGSGAIGLTLACEVPHAHVTLIDCSQEALDVAKQNAIQLGVLDRVSLVLANIFVPLAQAAPPWVRPFDVIVSNPPYITQADMKTLPPDVAKYEPHLALTAGLDGLDVIRPLVQAARAQLGDPCFMAIEVGDTQAAAVQDLMGAAFAHHAVVHDLANIERVVAGWSHADFKLVRAPFMGGLTVEPVLPQDDQDDDATTDPMGHHRD